MEDTTDAKTADEQVTELIALLDYYNFLKGTTLFIHPVRPDTTIPPPPTDGTPIAIQLYTTPSLTSHLRAHNTDLQTLQTLSSTIRLLPQNPSLQPLAHAKLDSEYLLLLPQPPAQNHTTFTQITSLTSKLATLRHLQHNSSESQLQRAAEFSTNLVASIDSAGRPDPLLRIWLPVATDWLDYARSLAMHTYHRWADADADDNDDDDDDDENPAHFPAARYTLEDGGWLYQRTSESGEVEKGIRELKCEGDFRGMRKEMAGAGNAGVLVWHARIWEASQTARRVEREARQFRADFRDVDLVASGVDFGCL